MEVAEAAAAAHELQVQLAAATDRRPTSSFQHKNAHFTTNAFSRSAEDPTFLCEINLENRTTKLPFKRILLHGRIVRGFPKGTVIACPKPCNARLL